MKYRLGALKTTKPLDKILHESSTKSSGFVGLDSNHVPRVIDKEGKILPLSLSVYTFN